MVEKVIDLNDIELVGFLGIENKNIQEVETAFPKTKIISRGNKISIIYCSTKRNSNMK